ncbi:anaerobic sulfite reduction protein A related protein [Thermoplasma acidophilum]|uniref:Anaerobic sulfite reduction protein A related protein n=1 Tax=Thermoplasma acidophilum (strain ATCC 25905 / DSM 1728 / JCM 9062 / NBRC 15155 / AMRC-C165) TaxID=273075 RepID=Q9HM25_THEAC|nr:4Fe-4S dicluster domain-containing protein [Thermoplasma acidophilum]MCY0851592.1 4Fe-4S dicluster domain-containing protein [Thermoplasma acidophilum]CAC11194.1 anaerobic sulfite reduction protein A related protein [Thermoplasma acidophilum]
MIYELTGEDMEELFRRISEEYETFGAKEDLGEVVFSKISSFSQVSEKKSSYSPKDFLIKRSENVLEVPRAEKKAVFGVKSCDLRGFQLMDLQILNKDPFYTVRRENTIFVNFVCNEMCPGGFCTSFGGPVLDKFDIQVIHMDGRYFVQADEKYAKFLEGFKVSEDQNVFSKHSEAFLQHYGRLELNNIEKRMKWSSKLWNEFANYCISCGACNYSCPTCYCIDVYDDETGRKKEWDSCILEGFTRTAAGNVRPDLSDRLRQRFYHKFKYYRLSKGEYLCTGCNRCVDDCPVDIDIKEVITHDYDKE